MRRVIALLLTLDALVLVGLVRPLRLAGHFPGIAVSLFNIIGINDGAIARFSLLVVLMVALYIVACRCIDDVLLRWRTLVIIAGAALLAFSFLLLYPATSNDLFHYVMEARILWVHHANPFTVAPDAYVPGNVFGNTPDPFFGPTIWANLPSPYGPIWVLLGGIPLLFGHGDPFWTYIGFKLLALAFYGISAVLIFHIVRLLRPGREWRATALFAWNPLVLMYVAGNGANDIIMMSFTLAAIYAAIRKQWAIAFPLLVLATMMKFVSGVLFPLFVVYALLTIPREQWRRFIPIAAVSSGMALLIYAPFWDGTNTFMALKFQANQFTDSVPSLILHWLGSHAGFGAADVIKASYGPGYFGTAVDPHTIIVAKTLAYLLFLGAYAYIGWGLYKRRAALHPDDLATAAFSVVFAYLIFAVLWFQPWYLLWLIPLGALTAGVRSRTTLIFTLTGLLTHSATAYAALKGWYVIHETWEVTTVVLTVFGLPALYVGFVLVSRTPQGRRIRQRIDDLVQRALPSAGRPRGGDVPAAGD